MKRVETFSGARFGKQGFCARLDGEYIKDDEDETAYFPTPEEAIEVAYDIWKEDQGQSQSSNVPQWFKSKIQIHPGFKNEGFCVKLHGRDYLRNRSGKIHYFPTPETAEYAAYEAWV